MIEENVFKMMNLELENLKERAFNNKDNKQIQIDYSVALNEAVRKIGKEGDLAMVDEIMDNLVLHRDENNGVREINESYATGLFNLLSVYAEKNEVAKMEDGIENLKNFVSGYPEDELIQSVYNKALVNAIGRYGENTEFDKMINHLEALKNVAGKKYEYSKGLYNAFVTYLKNEKFDEGLGVYTAILDHHNAVENKAESAPMLIKSLVAFTIFSAQGQKMDDAVATCRNILKTIDEFYDVEEIKPEAAAALNIVNKVAIGAENPELMSVSIKVSAKLINQYPNSMDYIFTQINTFSFLLQNNDELYANIQAKLEACEDNEENIKNVLWSDLVEMNSILVPYALMGNKEKWESSVKILQKIAQNFDEERLNALQGVVDHIFTELNKQMSAQQQQ